MAERIAVLGGGGFIGSHMVRKLKKEGHYVRAVSRHFPEFRYPLFGQADEIQYYNLHNRDHVLNALEGMDYVVHLAADMGGVGYFNAHDYYPFIDNMRIDLNVLEACRFHKIKRLFYASSACIYPTHLQMEEGNSPALREDMIYPAFSDQMYGWEKLMGLKLCERTPFDSRVGIFHTIFGPYQEMEGERMKFPTAIVTKALDAKESGTLEIWGNGKQERTFLYIDDAVEKIYQVLTATNYNGPVNIGSEEVVSVDQIAAICCDILDILPIIHHNESQPSGVLARGCDNGKFREEYGYENKFTTKEGFAELIKFVQEERNA